MRIAANLNVLDEIEFIEPCLQHLRKIGVDVIVVTDIGSTDGTLEHLESLSHDPNICLIRIGRNRDPWGFPARMYEKTIAEFEVDRVLFLDADEFWLPRSGNLKTTPSLARNDALSVRRLNVPPVENRLLLPKDLAPENYGEIYLIAKPLDDAERRFRSEPDLAWILTRIGPKTVVNPRTVEGVGMGTHQVLDAGQASAKVVWADDVIIAHLPFSNPSRFARKLENIERSINVFGHRLTGSQAWHWRRWLHLAQIGRVEEEFARQIMSEATFQAALTEGTVQSAQTILETMARDAGTPDARLSASYKGD